MKFNNAAKNLVLCHLDPTVNALVTGQFKRVIITLRTGAVPTEAALKAAFAANDSIVANVPQAATAPILTALGGTTVLTKDFIDVPQFGMLTDRNKRGYNFTTYQEESATGAGTVTWALVGIAKDSNYCHTFYVMTVGLKGSGADIELDKTNLVVGDKIKFSTILFDHSFIFGE